MTQAQAARLIAYHCIPIGSEFDALPRGTVNALTLAADASRYYISAGEEGSRAQRFFELLRRTVVEPPDAGAREDP